MPNLVDEKTVELYKKRLFDCHSCSHAEEILETLSLALKVVRAAQKLVVHCNHKPDGWDEVDRALAPFSQENGEEK